MDRTVVQVNWAQFVLALVTMPLFCFVMERLVWRRMARRRQSYDWKLEAVRAWRFCAAFCAVWQAITMQAWSSTAGCAVSALIAAVILWRRKKKHGKAARLLGAKARALRDALVRKARDAAIPRPVLAPNI